MSASALALVLAGAICHAIWNIVAKKVGGGLAFVWLFSLVSVAAAAPVAGWALLAHPQAFDHWMWFAALASGLVHVVYSLVLQKAYRESDFVVVYPVARGAGPMLAVVAAVVLLGERPSLPGWIAVAVILAGVFVSAGAIDIWRGSQTRRRYLGVLWGMLTGGFIATYTVIDGWAIKTLGMTPILFYAVGLVFRALLLAPFAIFTLRRTDALRSQWQEHWRAIILVGLLSPTAYALVLMAMQTAPLSYIAPVREISMLIGAFIGASLLKESVKRTQVVGAAIMLLGVAGLAWA
ncbi:MAG: EamA family transporter [Betaproteobacteria bacterium]|nr:EamA family transporter [Betaproteobacteria bacterium]